MNISENVGRWPPVYDFEELGQQIKDLINDGSIFHQFFVPHINGTDLFQGDIVSLKNDPVYIDKDGDIAIIDEDFNYWVILGNTCDLARNLTTDSDSVLPRLTHISPLIPVPQDIPTSVLNNLKKYKLYKRVFIPRWGKEENDFYIDLTIMNSIEKQCLIDHSNIMARLNFKTWLLLHSCLVRYYAFALNIVKICFFIQKNSREYVLSRQLLKSGTSIGANVEEAVGGISKADFLAKMQIAYKEQENLITG